VTCCSVFVRGTHETVVNRSLRLRPLDLHFVDRIGGSSAFVCRPLDVSRAYRWVLRRRRMAVGQFALELALEYCYVVTTNSVVDLIVVVSIPSDSHVGGAVAAAVGGGGGSILVLFAWY